MIGQEDRRKGVVDLDVEGGPIMFTTFEESAVTQRDLFPEIDK